MGKKIIYFIIAGLIVILLMMSSFVSGAFAGQIVLPGMNHVIGTLFPKISQTMPMLRAAIPATQGTDLPGTNPKMTSTSRDKLFEPFWEAWDIVQDQYIDQPVDSEKMMQGAIRGMVESLGDEHTAYMDPEQYQQMNIAMEGEYEGIGAWVDPSASFLTIISPMPDSPAEKAGLQAGDQIIAIDGKDMTGIDGNLVIKKVLGPAGSKVILTIQREKSDKPFNVTIIRARVVVPSVDGKILEEDNFAYIELYTFGENTERDLHQKLKELMDKKPTGLILDLRNNGGGYLDTAIDVASEFVKNGIILYEDYGNGKKTSYQAKGFGLATDIPMVVLINEGSASASEIVAGAIKDHDRGLLVGETSYGKGSVQNWINLKNDEGAVRVTIARWLTPNGNQINKKGLTPDTKINFTDEDIKAKKDVQLEKAVEVLKNEIDKQKATQ